MKGAFGIWIAVPVAFANSAAAAPIDLRLTVSAEVHGEKFAVSGETNLPDGAVLMVDMGRQASGYFGHAMSVVEGGRFGTMVIPVAAVPVQPGIYELRLTGPLTDTLPATTRAAVGKDYSNYRGPFVRKDSLGGFIEVVATAIVPGRVSDAEDAVARRKTDAAYWNERRQGCLRLPDDVAHFTGIPQSPERASQTIARCLGKVEVDQRREQAPSSGR